MTVFGAPECLFGDSLQVNGVQQVKAPSEGRLGTEVLTQSVAAN